MKSLKTLKQILQHYHISNYIVHRIYGHSHVYQHRIHKFEFSYSDVVLFRILYVILAHHLSQGHTLMRLDKNYQDALLSDMLSVLSESLEIDMLAWIHQMLMINQQNLSYQKKVKNDKHQNHQSQNQKNKSLYNRQIEILTQVINAKNIDIQTAELLQNFAMDMARLAYLINKLSFAEFCQKLTTHLLIDTMHYDTDDVPALPLVLRYDDELAYLWLQRAWQAEHRLAYHIKRLIQSMPNKEMVDIAQQADFLAMPLKDEQRYAIMTALSHRFTLITGGPGTGKTHTVAHLVMILAKMGEMNELALVAPTGKAAQRMQESLANALSKSDIKITLPEPKTIHRLLGIGQNGQANFNEQKPLSEDVIIVDEASMLGVELACALFAAIKPNTRLILLGDANQLAAVEAGAVLADLCQTKALNEFHVQLTQSERFKSDSGIAKLARLIQLGDVKRAKSVMTEMAGLEFVDVNVHHAQEIYKKFVVGYRAFFDEVHHCLNASIFDEMVVAKIFKAFNRYRVLCASHLGVYGDDVINEYLVDWHKNLLASHVRTQKNRSNFWYHGRAIMVNKNDYGLGLFNGDIGICLGVDSPKVYFEHRPEGIDISLITEEMVSTAYAMTVHKSQGSEFETVVVVFDDSHDRLLSQELIYTAITRAKEGLMICATPLALNTAISTPTKRQTGLNLHL